MYNPAYHDQPSAQMRAALLAQGQYTRSLSTLHRILRADAAHGDCGIQRSAQQHAIPPLCATMPNQVRTWEGDLVTYKTRLCTDRYAIHSLPNRTLAIMANRTGFPSLLPKV